LVTLVTKVVVGNISNQSCRW